MFENVIFSNKQCSAYRQVGAIDNPTFGANWSNFGAEFAIGEFYKDKENRVHLRGTVQNVVNAVGSVIYTLPDGYRPNAREIFTVWNGSSLGRVDVNASGQVILVQGINNWVSLNGISFRAN